MGNKTIIVDVKNEKLDKADKIVETLNFDNFKKVEIQTKCGKPVDAYSALLIASDIYQLEPLTSTLMKKLINEYAQSSFPEYDVEIKGTSVLFDNILIFDISKLDTFTGIDDLLNKVYFESYSKKSNREFVRQFLSSHLHDPITFLPKIKKKRFWFF